MIHHVFANRSNIGDWLSARGIQSLLRRPVVEHLCDEPFVPETLDELSRLGPGDLVVIGGGGLLMDYFMPFWTGFREVRGSTPYCLWGVGCVDERLERTLPDAAAIEQIVDEASLCFVRDELTLGFLRNVRVPEPVACPSLALSYPDATGGDGILHVVNYTTVGASAYGVMRSMLQAYAAQDGLVYRETNNRIEQGSTPALRATLDLYARSRVVVSSALHGCVVAIAMGLPVIAVSGDGKIDSFMAAAGLAEWVLPQAEANQMGRLLAGVPLQEAPRRFVTESIAANERIARLVEAIAP